MQKQVSKTVSAAGTPSRTPLDRGSRCAPGRAEGDQRQIVDFVRPNLSEATLYKVRRLLVPVVRSERWTHATLDALLNNGQLGRHGYRIKSTWFLV